jgi:predicted AlkP superfamily pyrophosphatase or phosphodiesterase
MKTYDYVFPWYEVLVRDEPNEQIQVETILEEAKQSGVPGNFYSALEQVYDMGNNDSIDTIDAVSLAVIIAKYELNDYDGGDSSVMDDVIHELSNPTNRPGVYVVWLTGLDLARHEKGPYSDTSINVLRGVDTQVGRLINSLMEHGIYDETLIVFTADHGQTNVTYGNILKNVTKAIEGSEYFNTTNIFRGDNKDNVPLDMDLVLRQEGGMLQLYVKDDSNDWSVLPDMNEARVREVLDYLQRYADTNHTIDEIFVRTGSGYELIKDYGTPYTDYPDADSRLQALFSDKSSDIIATAREGYSFGHPPGEGDHGSLRPEDSYVPIMFHGPGIAHDTLTSARTIDIAPTIANLLGFTMPDADGSVLPIQYLPLPGSLNGFVKDGEYFQTTVDVGSIPKLGITLTFIPIGGNDIDLRVISPSAKIYGFGGITEEDKQSELLLLFKEYNIRGGEKDGYRSY